MFIVVADKFVKVFEDAESLRLLPDAPLKRERFTMIKTNINIPYSCKWDGAGDGGRGGQGRPTERIDLYQYGRGASVGKSGKDPGDSDRSTGGEYTGEDDIVRLQDDFKRI